MQRTLLRVFFSVVSFAWSKASSSVVEITVNPSVTRDFPHFWKRSFGSGHAALGLRRDWQASLARAVKDYGLAGVRQHGIFDDDMNVVATGNTNGGYVYTWTNIDILWDVQVKQRVKPIVELGFMPLILANCSSLQYPNPVLVAAHPGQL